MHRYVYDGPVSESGHLIQNHWHGETWAISEAKAKVNLSYQFKRASNRPAVAKITLNGYVKRVD